jgi:glycerophosphoryl diester phosphodiesterase
MEFNKQGHRGSRGLMPENTIPAMYKAIDFNVTTLEVDVVISKDKKVVVSHEAYFHQDITTTPQGNYLTKNEAGRHLIYTMNYDSIKKYDVGLKPHPNFPDQEKIAVYKPLLEDLVDAAEIYAVQKGIKISYNIEIKYDLEGEGKKHPPVEEFVTLVMGVVKQKKISDRTNIQSFHPLPLQIIHKKYPSIIIAFLIESNGQKTVSGQLKQLGFTPKILSPHFSLVTPGLIKEYHEKNMKIIPWTVNTIEEIKRLKNMGVDGIITDYPNLFLQL